MSIIEIIVFFMLCWWMTFYIMLPIGLQKDNDQIVGQAKSAPKNARIKQKMIIASGLTVIITLIFYWYMS